MNETKNEIKRTDLIGKTGEITKNIKVIDAIQRGEIVSVRIKEDDGDSYWVILDGDISLYE
ncbi:hypothetical protein [Bacillus licheniformis]|uniref:hypothetical protein n=1 Tax=Bacillus licheniformis TaxID=1402 RepID=UPI00084A5342|nr:hypothetical protein [Bacillus licheniformis]AOP13639.1 hypothetical protein BL1202_00670 [Bacillus licheniformis]MEC0478770.1 hypothetical protein [Bacillus licheniformis]OJT67585.1 hypothetical protein BFP46_17580 [Bacillus licheniformis]